MSRVKPDRRATNDVDGNRIQGRCEARLNGSPDQLGNCENPDLV